MAVGSEPQWLACRRVQQLIRAYIVAQTLLWLPWLPFVPGTLSLAAWAGGPLCLVTSSQRRASGTVVPLTAKPSKQAEPHGAALAAALGCATNKCVVKDASQHPLAAGAAHSSSHRRNEGPWEGDCG